MDSTLLKQLLDVGDAFERVHPNANDRTLPAFLAWASAQPPASSEPTPSEPPHPYRAEAEVPLLQTLVAEYLTKAYRYFRGYAKKALDAAPLLTFDDFISLAYLADRGSLTKTELIEATVNEKTSGMLVLKRLLDRGLVAQAPDAHDRRSRQLTITPAGLATLEAVQPAVNQATALLQGDLSAAEQQQLGALLARLIKFHGPLFKGHKEASLNELQQLTQAHL